ncbi:MAG: dual specificity protein phosphatase family protein [Hahellaceae bacterium]|nr:dual specificity protein phosphatase family protein [Hahellaceae bacterium]
MNSTIFRVGTVANGQLFVMPRPSAEHLEEELRRHRQAGIDVIISLLEMNEQRELGLMLENDVATTLGMEFYRFSIQDHSVPSPEVAQRAVDSVCRCLEAGKCVVIHCRAGIGRTGVITSCVLMRYGMQSDDAMALVSSARGICIPDTVAQIDFIYDYETQLRAGEQ